MGKKTLILTEDQLKGVLDTLLTEQVFTDFDKVYDYKLAGNMWYTTRKGQNKWISLQKSPAAIKKLNAKYGKNIPTGEPKPQPQTTNVKQQTSNFDSKTFKNFNDGNHFRVWVNQNFPDIAKRLQLSLKGSFNNQYIVNALNFKHENTLLGEIYFKSNGKNIVKNIDWVTKVSPQVKEQVDYLKSINFNESYTILDDKNSIVYAVNDDSSLYRQFNVITGKHRGDEEKITTITNWFTDGIIEKTQKYYKHYKKTNNLSKTFNKIKDDYLSLPLFAIKNTPSGIYRRDNDLWGFLGGIRNLLLTSKFFNAVYGEKYISWETLDGKLIPIGFHGTKSNVRLDKVDNITPPKKRKMSYGCINFNDSDILMIEKFIKIGQYSFWLPDTTNDILRLS